MAEAEISNIPEYETVELNTKVFHVGSFANKWRETLEEGDLSLEEDEKLATVEEEDAKVAKEMGISEETAAELRLVCSVDTLRCAGDDNPNVIPDDTDLVTLGIRKKQLERRERNIIVDRTCRQETFLYEHELHAVGKKPENLDDRIEEGEVILTLNVFYPVIYQKHKYQKPYQTILVLGSQKLTELRDSLSCVSDLQIGGEFSNTPNLAPEHVSKDLYKSAFFYMEGVFFNDMRYLECRDLSWTIRDWAESLDRGYEKFQTVKMEDYMFNDLRIKVGFPYLYCHQGDCEHLIIITDIRLVHQDDCLDKTMYPLVVRKHWLWSRKCAVCKLYTARWVTNNDSFAPEDPCFFCDTCFRMLHYDKDDNKLGEFLAFPYVDPGIFN
ncbi:snRNA-activating protein complex subunit 3 [Latimeria chalumnae]|uniref:snRNA-activating protein complex subunit 3 n=1 Tax=Latimeria chalumnae TaxID=7897 RepID=UPI0006D9292E|nr:PREDICTED: snRNA-activating protein complex subunit 3 [Latimeria chalumnae]|eukprot:XP_006009437.2 PREDICTED: snRNA-activating protein complex subunit 3 [Latimeria chalumnae]